MKPKRDHGGGLDAAVQSYGGTRSQWVDLSTGINPLPYPLGALPADAWTDLPDSGAMDQLLDAARSFWNIPQGAKIIAAPGASAIIARIPDLIAQSAAYIPAPTYNEHAAAFHAHAPNMDTSDPTHNAHVYVHPNNPDGRFWPAIGIGGRPFTIIDESFCDIAPDQSHIEHSQKDGVIILKSFGKFWGLAGARLGFAIGTPDTLFPKARPSLNDLLGPWAVAGPALHIGTQALRDTNWATQTRKRLAADADRLDALVSQKGGKLVGGTSLFRLYEVPDAKDWQDRLAKGKVWSRVFPYSKTWIRLGLPHPDKWAQVEAAL